MEMSSFPVMDRAVYIDLYSALTAIEKWEVFDLQHLLLHISSVIRSFLTILKFNHVAQPYVLKLSLTLTFLRLRNYGTIFNCEFKFRWLPNIILIYCFYNATFKSVCVANLARLGSSVLSKCPIRLLSSTPWQPAQRFQSINQTSNIQHKTFWLECINWNLNGLRRIVAWITTI